MNQLGYPQTRYPHWHLGRLPDGVCNAVSRICIALMSSKWRLLFSQTPRLRVVQHTSVFCMWKKEVGVFVRVLYSWGSQLPIHFVSFLQRRNHGLNKFSLALSCATLREGWQRSSEIVLFSLSMCLILDFFPCVVLECLCWTIRLL